MAVVSDVKRDPPVTSWPRLRLRSGEQGLSSSSGDERTRKTKPLAMNSHARSKDASQTEVKTGWDVAANNARDPQGADDENRGHSRDQSKKTHHPCHAARRMQRSRVHESGGKYDPPGTSICFNSCRLWIGGITRAFISSQALGRLRGHLDHFIPLSLFGLCFFPLCPAFPWVSCASTRNTQAMQPSNMAKPN